jgi:hypothetical protein
MVRLSLHQDDYLATTKHYLAVYHTLQAREETLQARAILQNVLIFVILSPYGNEQSDLLARVVREDPVKNGQMDWAGKFVQSFTHGEILRQLTPPSGVANWLDGPLYRMFMAPSYVSRISSRLTKAMARDN